jgi:hypothetical protein
MTSGNADRLKKVADALLCVKCQARPRFGSLQRCKPCLQADAAVERAAREKLLPAQAATTRQQTAASRAAARKPLAAAPTAPVVSKALTTAAGPALPAVVTPVVAEPVRELGKPFTLAQWQVLITQTLKRFRAAGTVAQNRMAEGSLAAKTIAENTAFARVTYGDNALVTLRPRSNAAASLLHWALERAGVRFDLIDVHGDITDVRTICEFCDAKVRRPCNESRSRNCANRSRGNR